MKSATASLLLLAACRSSAAPPAPAAAQSTSPASAGSTAPPPIREAVAAPPPAVRDAAAGPAHLAFRAVALPGASAPASLDYIAFEAARGRVWVPVGDTASADVYDPHPGTFTRVDGFKTEEREWHGKRRAFGPSSVSLGEGVAYVGDRGSNEVCVVDTTALAMRRCLGLSAPPDGVVYVSPTKEVWVTTPRDHALVVLDASVPDVLHPKATIPLDGSPEGYAVDAAHALFYTNLEDKDRTVVIDIRARSVKATWKPECGGDGPRGLAVDPGRSLVFVACTDHVVALDGTRGGAIAGQLDTGAGVDNIDWLEARRLLFVGAARAAKLVVAHADEQGHFTIAASGESVVGARNAVADAAGASYLADPQNARLLVFDAVP